MSCGNGGRDFDGEWAMRCGDMSQRGAESDEPGDTAEHGFRQDRDPRPGLTLELPPGLLVLLLSPGSLLLLLLWMLLLL